jgi:hypothetical protein
MPLMKTDTCVETTYFPCLCILSHWFMDGFIWLKKKEENSNVNVFLLLEQLH